jgi:hypothetical protein
MSIVKKSGAGPIVIYPFIATLTPKRRLFEVADLIGGYPGDPVPPYSVWSESALARRPLAVELCCWK